jgi:excinuclease ABC subunit A
MMTTIQINEARENNLKNISLEIPHNKLILLTGVSGSGKTSLAYDVLFKEGQGRFLESFSSHTRSYLTRLNRPDVDEIRGLRPAVAVNQNSRISNARSTVGTISRLYDLLRLLFARLGEATADISPLKQQRRLFSFNTPYGACPQCKGLGMEEVIDPDLIIKNPELSLREGALVITQPNGYTVYSQVTIDVMDKVCRSEGFNVDIPWKDLTEAQKNIVWYGSDKIKIPFGKHSLESRMKWSGITAKPREEGYYKGIIPIMEEILKRDRNANILRFVKARKCSHCGGKRLNHQALSIHFAGMDIADFNAMSISMLDAFFRNHQNPSAVFSRIRSEILEITDLLAGLGLGHLQLERESASLSGGESRRIRLANQVLSRLSGMLFIFDEPSIGMHSRDQKKLLQSLRRLVDKGNTVMVIEHEQDFIPAVDWIVDIGPKAGTEGGEVLFNGPAQEFIRNPLSGSLTKEYFERAEKDSISQEVQGREQNFLSIRGATVHNLQNVSADFLLGALNVVCGVSGSGKSSLVLHCLAGEMQKEQSAHIVSGRAEIKQVIAIDQSPIGRTPRSNPATYTKMFDYIRKLFASLPEAVEGGFGKSDFSFNVKGGRCEVCQGAGYRQIGMHFIGNVEIRCEHCGGKRFSKELLEIRFRGKNIYEVLEMRVDEAVEFFREQKDIYRIVSALQALGLGYLTLGQRATTLSGGEAQRVKLATEMSRKTKGKTLYILDEPTTGLHAYDVEILMRSLEVLRNQGHTIIVIEHHHDLIRRANRIIELGPEGGKSGGKIVYQGALSGFLKTETLTAKALKGDFRVQPAKNQSSAQASDFIELKAVRTHNLKAVDVRIPKNKFTVISGLSGSGKSSLAFDTLAAEGRMQFLQTLPNYIRGRLNTNSQAKFDEIKGLTPVISIDAVNSAASARSTLGTMSDVYDLLRLLYSRIGILESGRQSGLPASAFSFNNQDAACSHCSGLGELTTTDPEKLISHPRLSILEGAMGGSKTGRFYGDANGQYVWTLKTLDEELKLGLERPWAELDAKAKDAVLFGVPGVELDVEWKFTRKGRSGSHRFKTRWQGLVALIDEEYQRKHADKRGENMLGIMKVVECPQCRGARLQPQALAVKVGGLNIAELSDKSVAQCMEHIQSLEQQLNPAHLQISKDIRRELLERLQGLINMELEYLQINRKLSTLSGGELQRLRIAGHIYSAMSGITYVLDEPATGLHPRNTHKLLEELQKLKNNGNTVVLVEHNRQLIDAADYLILMGPGAGAAGGEIVAEGTPARLNIEAVIGSPEFPQIVLNESFADAKPIQIRAAFAHNLKHIDLDIPTACLSGISGVSGSGKSSLLFDVLYRSAQARKAVNCVDIKGLEQFDEVIPVNQNPDAATQNSIVATYLGFFDAIRKLFAAESGTSHKLFSFNTPEGRCPHCQGAGQVNVRMDFLSDISELCPECKGSRYNEQSLQHRFHGKNIAEVLQMSIAEAFDFFAGVKNLIAPLEMLKTLGLGYLPLGQSLNTISGGEAQRLKLVKHILTQKSGASRKLFLLDEPSRGLANKDIRKLLQLFGQLISAGHSIILIEHNHAILEACNFTVELGPGGGENGGRIIL